jgi:Flp pilus assembly protein TadG
MFRLFRRNREKGASLVEFALILPLFLFLIFGMMEAAWAFAQTNDIHHAVREGARLAAVNHDPDDNPATNDVLADMCDRMGMVAGSAPTVTLSATDSNTDGFIGRGDTGTSTVRVNYQSLTGFLDPIFGSLVLSSDADFRLEQSLEAPSAAWMVGPVVCP